jgi:hypothetical protein
MLLKSRSWVIIRPYIISLHFIFNLIISNVFCSTSVFAQEIAAEETPLKSVISFDETLDLSIFNTPHFQNVTWTIVGIDDINYSKKGKGAELKSIKFNKPGQYVIGLKEVSSQSDVHVQGCNHSNFPQEIHLTVLPYRVTFNFDGVVFSKPINGGKELESILLTVPAKVECYNKSSVDVTSFYTVSAGVGATITGKIINGIDALAAGEYMFTYALKGSAQKNTYIMFDFFNGEKMLSTYYLPYILN